MTIRQAIDRLEQIDIRNAAKEDYEAVDIAVKLLEWVAEKEDEIKKERANGRS